MAYDLRDPRFLADPSAMLATMRSQAPLVQSHIPMLGKTWLTTDDATARKVLKSGDLFVRDPASTGGKPLQDRFWWLPRFMTPLIGNMLGQDGADHARLRGLVDRAFARTSIADMRDEITGIADTLLDRLPTDQPVELLAGYARPLPLQAICVLLGVPGADRDRVARWIAPISGPTGFGMLLMALPGLWRTMRHFRQDFKTVRDSPRAGLISALVETQDHDDGLSEDELLAMVVTLFIAGHETTVHLIGNAVDTLLRNRDVFDALRADPTGVPIFVEEIMRSISPVMLTKPHFATQDMVFEGVPLKKGDQVMALLIAANHDPARFEAPQRLCPARRPNPHLGFGHGPHVCLGMQLARVETEIALTRLMQRFPDMQLTAPDEPIVYARRIGFRGPHQLNVILRPK